jgi:glycosylphosphatidylinositol transamidase (GPIT) subunit GPI8
MENRKTAMQELFDNLESIDIKVPIGVKKIFLEKEKEWIINTFKEAQVLHAMNNQMRGEQYYMETYGK